MSEPSDLAKALPPAPAPGPAAAAPVVNGAAGQGPADAEARAAGGGVPRPPRVLPDRVDGRLRPSALYRWGFFVGLGVLSAYLAGQAVFRVHDVLIRVMVALFLAVSLDPAVRWLVAHGVRRGLAVTVIFGVFLLLLSAFLLSVIPPMVRQFGELAHRLPGYLDKFQVRSRSFRDLDARYHLSTRLEGAVAQLPGRLTGGVLGITGEVFGALVSFLTVAVFTVYFLLDLPRLRKGVVRLFTVDRRERYGAIVDIVVNKVGDYMIGRLLIAAVGGLVAFVGLELLRVPYPLPLAIFIALLDLIPLLGHPVGASVGVLVALFAKGLWPTTVLLIVFFLVYQQLENYWIGPRIMRESVDISSAAVLLAALIGATVLGVVGALIAIPLAAAVKVVAVQHIDAHEAAAEASGARRANPRRLRRPRQGGR